ncbi:hypothetical protein NP233_g5409 [Leucocoprinus birnbaumii]|uniref:Uncharacterized protein n=1 Tax=Leucocoprinus birnbaumii TaxID=56174 RepID=A0AAD5VTC2_9AGAR|nr:hypothetical protein NP233_g5409 [Leucocoprinus birnbaumii]
MPSKSRNRRPPLAVGSRDLLLCDICCTILDKSQHLSHFTTDKHLKKASEIFAPKMVFCPLCERFFGEESWKYHLKTSKNHAERAMEHGSPVTIEPEYDIPDDVDRTHQLCEICEVYVPHERWEDHPANKMHNQLDQYMEYKIGRLGPASLETNNVAILGNLEFDVVPPEVSGQGIIRTIEVRATEPLAMVVLISYELASEGSAEDSAEMSSP